MTQFNESQWALPEFSREYRDNADIFIVERKRLFEIMKSFYRYFIYSREQKSILDLGCGDGIITHNLLEIDASISATLVDPSSDMMSKARERFSGYNNINFVQASFQDLLKSDIIPRDFDFIVSSMAIHHLDMDNKKRLFNFIFIHLKKGGYFMNIDTVLPPADNLEHWYFRMWNEWVDNKKNALGLERDIFSDLTRRYKDAAENKPDTLEDQLNALRDIGFKGLDCFYKYGIFSVFGGKKETS
ncbi:MAG: class I SAM-dependent methyltransferase [Nitrospiraceae bacterium]|nr:MAG: class I SAM-dependent methyltransferase [Nitrospiraceae bacterium]